MLRKRVGFETTLKVTVF